MMCWHEVMLAGQHPLYLIIRTSEAHCIPPPSVHATLLHLTAEVFDSIAFEEAAALHLLGIWCVLTAHRGGARDEIVIFVSQILEQLLASFRNMSINVDK
jgi:hypothetical protein